MANVIKYTLNKTTKVAAKGLYTASTNTIETDDGIYKVDTLLKDFDGEIVAFSVSTKSDEELDLPFEEEVSEGFAD